MFQLFYQPKLLKTVNDKTAKTVSAVLSQCFIVLYSMDLAITLVQLNIQDLFLLFVLAHFSAFEVLHKNTLRKFTVVMLYPSAD